MLKNSILFKKFLVQEKSRTTKHDSYPQRFFVPEELVKWEVPYASYKPVPYTAPVVLNPETTWADPEEVKEIALSLNSFHGITFDNAGYPLNPFGRTGINRRGILGKWGPNKAADGIVTTYDATNNALLLLAIVRSDTGEFAFPGGMAEPAEDPVNTRNRELMEELSIDPEIFRKSTYEKLIYQGFVDDPRNTDNAWMETSAFLLHLPYALAGNLQIVAGDDAKDFKWINICTTPFENFYASHGLILITALESLLSSQAIKEEKLLSALKKILT